jgi:hypothetical protein
MPLLFIFNNQSTPHNITQKHKSIKRYSPCNSLPPFSLSLQALLSSWPRPTLPFAAAELHSAASLTSLILLPSPARTVSVGFTFPSLNLLTTSPATGAPQTIDEFDADCATLGVTAQCCLLPIVSLLTFVDSLMLILISLQLGQGLICASP